MEIEVLKLLQDLSDTQLTISFFIIVVLFALIFVFKDEFSYNFIPTILVSQQIWKFIKYINNIITKPIKIKHKILINNKYILKYKWNKIY